MKKILVFIAISTIFFLFNSCNRDNKPTNEFLINENQLNWNKLLLVQRPICDLPDANSEYCKTTSGLTYCKGDTLTAYVSVEKTSNISYIILSKNGGSNWTIQSSQSGLITSTDQIGETSFALRKNSNKTEFGIGMQYGASWSWKPIPGNPNKIRALNSDTLYAFGNDGIVVSENGGNSWTINNTSIASDIQNYDDSTLIGVFNKEIKLSSNLGKTWNTLHTADYDLNLIKKGKGNTWFAGGSSGILLKSNDNGINWEAKFLLINIYYTATYAIATDLLMIDSNNGFATIDCQFPINCGDSFKSMVSCILKTIDGGETWRVNYRTELIHYTELASANGPKISAFGTQNRDRNISGAYVTFTKTLGN